MKYQEAMEMLREFGILCIKQRSLYFYIGFIQSNLANLIDNGDQEHSIRVIQKAIKDYNEELTGGCPRKEQRP